jgi:hypothetical protein
VIFINLDGCGARLPDTSAASIEVAAVLDLGR